MKSYYYLGSYTLYYNEIIKDTAATLHYLFSRQIVDFQRQVSEVQPHLSDLDGYRMDDCMEIKFTMNVTVPEGNIFENKGGGLIRTLSAFLL